MFLVWKNQHCENDYTMQSNLQIQCNPCQTANGIFHRTRTKNCMICMETQKTPNSQNNLEKEKQSWRNRVPRLQTILQSYSNPDSMVLAQKHKYRGFPGGAVVESLPASAGDTGSGPGLGGSHMPRSNWARGPQLLSLRVWSLCSATGEAAMVRGPRIVMKSGPCLPQLEKALVQRRRPNTAINK